MKLPVLLVQLIEENGSKHTICTLRCCCAQPLSRCNGSFLFGYQVDPSLPSTDTCMFPVSVEGHACAVAVGVSVPSGMRLLFIEGASCFVLEVSSWGPSMKIQSIWIGAELNDLLLEQERYLMHFALADLPMPALSVVLRHLPLQDAVSLARVSRRCAVAFDDEMSWEWRLRRLIGEPATSTVSSWKLAFKDHVRHHVLQLCMNREAVVDVIHDFLTPPTVVSWKDIALSGDAKLLLQRDVVLPCAVSEYVRGVRYPGRWRGVLVYGPDGAGKTLLANAVATEGSATFFNVSLATVARQRDPGKIVRSLFELARFYAPSIILIDQIDSWCRDRNWHVASELLMQLDEVAFKNQHVIVLATSGCPWDIEEPILRRFEKRVYVQLPDCGARKQIFEQNTGGMDLASDVNFLVLSEKAEGYSGADISLVCRDASLLPLRRAIEGLTPDEVKSLNMSQVGAVRFEDFTRSLGNVKPPNVDYIQRMEKWGQDRP